MIHSKLCQGDEDGAPCTCDGVETKTCPVGWFCCPHCDTGDDWHDDEDAYEGETLVCGSCAYTSALSFEEQGDVPRWRWTHDSLTHANGAENRGYS